MVMGKLTSDDQPRVLLFDIGGVCVGANLSQDKLQNDTHGDCRPR